MKKLSLLAIYLLSSVSIAQAATTDSALSCTDFVPTDEALQRFPDLIGACESVVERDGELYGKFRAIVRRAGSRTVTLYLPATDHTFTVEPQSGARVLVGNQKVRPRDLTRGSEVRIYLASRAFATPDIEEISLVTDTEAVITHPVVTTRALPTTASVLPGIALSSAMLLVAGFGLRRIRRHRERGNQK
ncbi:MAG: hypothetical protein ACR2PZ_26570 [Pseudomonadales bacterium]